MTTIGDIVNGLKGMFALLKEIFEFLKPLFGIKDDEDTTEAE
ncbi:MAG: hypothetical protein Q4D20_06800 [Clostridia bacterium]|nr:hypothetical protein [Clostridia bacterium]